MFTIWYYYNYVRQIQVENIRCAFRDYSFTLKKATIILLPKDFGQFLARLFTHCPLGGAVTHFSSSRPSRRVCCAVAEESPHLGTKNWHNTHKSFIQTDALDDTGVVCSQPKLLPWFWDNWLVEEVFCGSYKFSATGWAFQFSLHLTTIKTF